MDAETTVNDSGGERGADRSFGWALWGALPVALAAMAVRWRMNFTGAYPGGMDAGYYPLQARDLIERGHLSYVDLPLTFWIDALVTRVIMMISGQDVDAASVLATRIVDSLAQPMTAVPLAALVWAWTRGRRPWSVALGSAAAALLATFSPSVLRMTGDFQKQSLGLVWLAGSAWAVNNALTKGGWRRWAVLALMVALSGLTHVGVIGATLVLVTAALTSHVVLTRGWSVRRLGFGAVGLVLALGAVLAGVWLVSPNKARQLVQAPSKLFGSGENAGGFGGPGGPGGPGGGAMSVAFVLVGVLTLWAAWRLWRDRRAVHPAAMGVTIGSAATALFLCNPLINGEYAMRLALMTPVPAAIVLAFVLSRRATRGLIPWPAVVLSGVTLSATAAGMGMITLPMGGMMGGGPGGGPPGMGRGPGGPGGMESRGGERGENTDERRGPRGRKRGPGGMGGPGGGMMSMRLVSDEQGPELRAIRDLLPEPRKTMILARHGLEWWAGYFTKAAVRPGPTAPDWAFEKYEHVYVLVEKGVRMGPPMGGPGGAGADDFGPPEGGPGFGPPDFAGPEAGDSMDGPRGGGRARGPGGRGNGPGGGPGGGMMGSPTVPAGSTIVHEGTYYRLYELARPTAASGAETNSAAR